jgi:hypothetical protein
MLEVATLLTASLIESENRMKHPQHTTSVPGGPTLRQISGWHEDLRELHGRLRPHFARPEVHQQALRYLQAVLSDVPRKNGWQLAEQARQARPYDEVGGQRGAVCFFRPIKDFSDGFLKTVLLQPPLPEPCRLLSQHTALQRGDSTGIGLTRHPPHPLGSVHLLLWPFTLSWALPQAFDYYDHSAPMRLSPCRESHRLTFPFVRL